MALLLVIRATLHREKEAIGQRGVLVMQMRVDGAIIDVYQHKYIIVEDSQA
jgi:hypothetical protein